MARGSRLVHVRGGHRARFVSLVHECHHLLVTAYDELGEVFDVGTQTGVFADAEVARVLGVQKVAHLFVVYLQ